jgi:hypothetical protein
VVVLLSREARQVVDDHEVDLALVRATELEKVLELGPVRGLGALAFFLEPLKDLVSFALAVLLARAQLRRQTEVLGLLLRAHADVDHRADHRTQLSAIVGARQGDRYAAHSAYSCGVQRSRKISTITWAMTSACRRI